MRGLEVSSECDRQDGVCVSKDSILAGDAGAQDSGEPEGDGGQAGSGSVQQDAGHWAGDDAGDVDRDAEVRADASQAGQDAGPDAQTVDPASVCFAACTRPATAPPATPCAPASKATKATAKAARVTIASRLVAKVPSAGANSTCSNGTGAVQDVDCVCTSASYANCNETNADGCEADLLANADYCGACNASCADNVACQAGACVPNVVRLIAAPERTCALIKPAAGTTTNQLRCWGRNSVPNLDLRILGLSTFSDQYSSVPRIADALDVRGEIASGLAHSCAIAGNADEVKCWGYNLNWQLGVASVVPVGGRVTKEIPGVKQLAAGTDFTCALDASRVSCWGSNQVNQLGRTTADAQSAALVAPALPAGTFSEVRAAGQTACARASWGAVYCWGAGYAQPAKILNVENATSLVMAAAPAEDATQSSRRVCAKAWAACCAGVHAAM